MMVLSLARRTAAWLTLLMLLPGCMSMPESETSRITSLSEFRTAHGLSAAAPDPALERMAKQQAQFMAATGRMRHTTAPGRDFASRMRANGVKTAAAENVAYNADGAGRAFELWANSPPHRRNMMEPRFGHYGLASAPDKSGKLYWALVLGE